MVQPLWKTVWQFLKGRSIELLYDPAIPLLGLFHLKRNENMGLYKTLHTNARSGIIHNSQRVEKPKCPSTGQWINKMWYIHTMEGYSAINRNEVLVHDTTWINLENIMLREKEANMLYVAIYMKYLEKANL